ncbi:hypothetical protein SKAU_G00060070 [Synaphobranchus kaupii]|uniref:Uncharacterized protein n=1 Tax=Synaphobranchus kaupii TaxID=118154 RepID=A0A9Q1G4Q4_SYNKA|nr:hypothetical protein SKAU_G00060070 [Synaphobranchus kaupii]
MWHISFTSIRRMRLSSPDGEMGWEVVLKEMGLQDLELLKPPIGVGTEAGESTAATWRWYASMDETIGQNLYNQPPILVASAWVSPLETKPTASQPEERPGLAPKRQRVDPVLEFLERGCRDDEREERLIKLLENIVENFL